MSTLKLILTKGNNIYPDPNDNSKDLFRRLTGESSELPFMHILEFNNTIRPILVDYGINYKIYREGEETLTDAIYEAIGLLEKADPKSYFAHQRIYKAINILKKALP